MSGGALVIGGDIRGVQTALDLADCGIKVTLVEPSPSLQANNAESPGESGPENNAGSLRLIPKLLKAAHHPNINMLTNASVVKVKGTRGDLRVTVVQQPRYINADLCTSCARCERECPVNIISLAGETLDEHKAIHRPDYGLKSVPSAYVVDKKGVPPCTAACPAGVNVQGYVALISQGKFDEALDLITEAVPFPRVLGRICTHPCESECTRGKVDQPVAICALKRFASNGSSSLKQHQVAPPSGEPRVAIIGAGPAGLTAARDLARLGHRGLPFGDLLLQNLSLRNLTFLVDVHIPLREGDRDAFLVEPHLHRAGHVPVDIPVVVGFHPRPHHEIDRGIVQGVQAHHGFGIIQNPVIVLQDIIEDLLRVGNVEGPASYFGHQCNKED